ncbi:MAG: TIGR01906 family membrane protein [Dehalococcoidia bacterium]
MTSASDVEGAAPAGDPPAEGTPSGGERPPERGRGRRSRPSVFALAASEAVLLFQGVWGRLQRARWLARVGAVLFVIALPLALIGTNVRVLFTAAPLYTFALDQYDVPAVTGIPRQELERAMAEIRDYFTNDQELLRITVTDDRGRTNPLFTPREVIHMRDVKELVQAIFLVQWVAIGVVAGYVALRLAIERGRAWAGLARLTRISMLGTLVVALAFGASTLIGFERLFEQFHQLSFSNDFWQLDPTQDHLVQMFPEDFWLVATVILAGMTLIEVLALLAASWGYLQRVEQSEPAPPATTEQPSAGEAG